MEPKESTPPPKYILETIKKMKGHCFDHTLEYAEKEWCRSETVYECVKCGKVGNYIEHCSLNQRNEIINILRRKNDSL